MIQVLYIKPRLENLSLLMFCLQKLDIPTTLGHTDSSLPWFINPMGKKEPMELWLMILAVIPAFLIFLLLFLESQLTQYVFCHF